MAPWREENPDVFAATIVTAAEQLRVQPLAVEKDYWVCEVLRTIAAHHRDEIVFKGGTSLEKLRIIKRFSEDLDLLVLDHSMPGVSGFELVKLLRQNLELHATRKAQGLPMV